MIAQLLLDLVLEIIHDCHATDDRICSGASSKGHVKDFHILEVITSKRSFWNQKDDASGPYTASGKRAEWI